MTNEKPTPDENESDDTRPDPKSQAAEEPISADAGTDVEASAEEVEVQPEDESKETPPADTSATEVEVESSPEPAEAPTAETPTTDVEVEMQSGEEPEEKSEPKSTPPTEVTAETESPSGGEASESSEAETTMAEAVAQDQRLETKLKAGERREVRLVQVGEKESFVDFGGASEGTIATAELRNDEGELRVKEGEAFPAIVAEVGETISFTTGKGKKHDTLKMRDLEMAAENKIPLQGKVKKTNKGGFEVDLQGVRAFCPFSQIDIGYCDEPEQFVGQDLTFRIMTFERGGRNIVLSRRKILEEEAKEAAKETRENLEIGATFEGVVRRLQPYGAFVDIGGIDGLVHVSEISHTHVRDPKDILKVGQKVPVKVIKLEELGTKRERVSLSMKELAQDPWTQAAEKWPVGSTVGGKVVRLTEFGAFVELEPGVDGLIHISQISADRIDHPSDELSVGQEVEVRVLDLEAENHRISLTLRPEGEDRPPRQESGRSEGGRDRGPRNYTAEPEKKEDKPDVDVTGMEYDDALEILKRKFDSH